MYLKSGAPPCARRYFESCENASEITCSETNSAHLRTAALFLNSRSYTITWGRLPRWANATSLRFLFTPEKNKRDLL